MRPRLHPLHIRSGRPERRTAQRLTDADQRLARQGRAGQVDRTERVRRVEADGAITLGDFLVESARGGENRTLTLPDARMCRGRKFVVKDTSGDLEISPGPPRTYHTLKVLAIAGQSVENHGDSRNVTRNFGTVTLRSTGTGWVLDHDSQTQE